MLNRLIQLGVDPNAYEIYSGGDCFRHETALHNAIQRNDIDAIKILIKAGAKDYLRRRSKLGLADNLLESYCNGLICKVILGWGVKRF